MSFTRNGASAWADTFRIDALLKNGSEQSYFLKVGPLPFRGAGGIRLPNVCHKMLIFDQVSTGHHGRESLKGEYESTSAISLIVPDFVPKPIGWGTYALVPDTHFYICEFHNLLVDELPSAAEFCEKLAILHKNSSASRQSGGKFGFHVTTYNGNLPQENAWQDSWEKFFVNGLKHMFALNEEAGGKCEELENLLPALFEKVIPRLLRPLETNGNTVIPALVHGDLWCGNASVRLEDDAPIIFDPSSFWAHNECKIFLFLLLLSISLVI